MTLSRVEIMLSDGDSVECETPDLSIVDTLEDAMKPERANSVISVNVGDGRTASLKCSTITGYKLHPAVPTQPNPKTVSEKALSPEEASLVAHYRDAMPATQLAARRMLGVTDD